MSTYLGYFDGQVGWQREWRRRERDKWWEK